MCIRDRKLSRAVGWWSEPLPGSADVADRQRIGKNQSSQQKAGCSSLTSSWSQEGSQGIDIMSIVSSQTLRRRGLNLSAIRDVSSPVPHPISIQLFSSEAPSQSRNS